MTKKDFFILLIKLFGLLFFVRALFYQLPSLFFVLYTQFELTMIISSVVIFVLLSLVVFSLVFKAGKVVEILKLDKGFDEERIDLSNLNIKTIAKFAIFLIGGLMIMDYLPEFISYAILAFKGNNIGINYSSPSAFNWFVSGLNLLIGGLLIANYSFITRLLFKQELVNETEQPK
jgi:hypothetical protein